MTFCYLWQRFERSECFVTNLLLLFCLLFFVIYYHLLLCHYCFQEKVNTLSTFVWVYQSKLRVKLIGFFRCESSDCARDTCDGEHYVTMTTRMWYCDATTFKFYVVHTTWTSIPSCSWILIYLPRWDWVALGTMTLNGQPAKNCNTRIIYNLRELIWLIGLIVAPNFCPFS